MRMCMFAYVWGGWVVGWLVGSVCLLQLIYLALFRPEGWQHDRSIFLFGLV